MRSPRGIAPALAAVLPMLAYATHASASNFRPYVIGSRAAGMGGAFTALADDGSGPFYNPGGVAFVQRSQLSLSGSVYGLVRGTIEDALTDGHDFDYQNLNVFPTAASAVWRLGAPEERSGNALAYRSEHTSTNLGLNVSGGSGRDVVPHNLDFRDMKVTGASQLLAYVFLASSYEF